MSLETNDKETLGEFKQAVNMSAGQIEKWLDSDESKRVGFKSDYDDESVGHQSGKRIVEILGKKQDEYTADDFRFMKKLSATCIAIRRNDLTAMFPKRIGVTR